MPVNIRPEVRTPEQIQADEEIATAHETGMVPAEWRMTEIVPEAERWAVSGVLFARHLGFGAGLPPDQRRGWDEGFRRELVGHHPELHELLRETPRRLTPEVEAAVRAAAGEYHTRFLAGLATAPALARG